MKLNFMTTQGVYHGGAFHCKLTNDINSAGVSPYVAPPELCQNSQGLLSCHIIVCCQQAIQEVLDASVQLLIAVLLIGSLDICAHQLA